MNQFDMCQFENRKYWKVFLETGHQPSWQKKKKNLEIKLKT
jgi:hypothetical protein